MRLPQTSATDLTSRGEGMGLTLAQWTSAVLYNGLARCKEALAAAEQAAEDGRTRAAAHRIRNVHRDGC